ncbi:MAG: NAD(P)H-dependent oxidoreductase subunit E [Anaerovoracaceae bacterium]|jgi:NADH:ubiquinone oxidoreductase subunit E
MQKDCMCSCDKSGDPRFVELKEYIDSVKGSDGVALPILQQAQRIFGFLPLDVHRFITEHTGIPTAELYGISTFYSQFTITPKGKHKIGVCLGTACYVKGAQKIVDKLIDELNIQIGNTTSDGLFTLDATRCLGCCGLAPVMMIDDDVYGKLDDIEAIPAILEKYKDKVGAEHE